MHLSVARSYTQRIAGPPRRRTGAGRGSPAEPGAPAPARRGAASTRRLRDGDVILDADGRIRIATRGAARTLGARPAALRGVDWFARLHPDDLAAARASWRQVQRAGGVSAAVHCRWPRQGDGGWHFLEVRLSNLLGDPAVRGIAANIRESTPAEALLARQNDLLIEAALNGQEQEREWVSMELHDGVCQTLATAFQYLEVVASATDLPAQQAARVQRAQQLVQQAIREARGIVARLRPDSLATHGLVAALSHDVEAIAAGTGIRIAFRANVSRLPKAVETSLYRITHEALHNAVQHAGCSSISIRLRQTPSHCVLVICDDGVGFDAAAVPAGGAEHGIGLISMRKRTELLRGRFLLRSRAGSGTGIRVVLPTDRQQEEGAGRPGQDR